MDSVIYFINSYNRILKMSKKEIIELLESIDQNINDGNLDDAQIDIAINLRTLYKELVNE